MITIFTPTYNRKNTLNRLYNSLCAQTSYDFEWIVIDDGSTDDTKTFFETIKQESFPIRYYYQENGGKHRAINKGVSLANGEYFFIVDSDDYLTPNAVSIISEYIKNINDSSICGIVGLRVDTLGRVIGTQCNYSVIDIDFLSYRTKLHIQGDRAEIVRTSIMREYLFPTFDGEKFCTEAVVWNRIAQKYKARYINERFYICEYQLGGLTDNYNKIMRKSPKASLLYFKEMFSYPQVNFFNKVLCLRSYMHYLRLLNYNVDSNLHLPFVAFFYLPFVYSSYIYSYIKNSIVLRTLNFCKKEK